MPPKAPLIASQVLHSRQPSIRIELGKLDFGNGRFREGKPVQRPSAPA